MTQHNIPLDTGDVLLYITAFFLPPFPVIIRVGFWTNQMLLNILLTFLFGLPGTLHALYIIYITSPITGSQDRRVANGDYERLVESENSSDNLAPIAHNFQPPQPFVNEPANVGNSSNQSFEAAAPPPYEPPQGHGGTFPTDNKVQKQ